MVPLTTIQGLKTHELQKLIAGREAMIWGVGDLAQDVFISLTKSGIDVAAFLHTQPKDDFLDRPVKLPNDALVADAFIVLATPTWGRQAQDWCVQQGLKKNVDFVTHLSISRPQAVVEISNVPIRSPFHLTAAPDQPAFMDVDTFRRVVEKLNTDIPNLSRIILSYLGDPTLHPQLDDIIAIAKAVAPVTMTQPLSDPYVMPYNAILDYAEGKKLPESSHTAIKSLPWDIDANLALCKQDMGLPCLSQRVFPVIKTTLEVVVCHLFDGQDVAENYLTTDWAQILQNRHQSTQCEQCQAKGLHRLDLDVLKRRHGLKG